ncbi:hypothetical protein Ciccas_005508 [Cichlidogyrus casuarinus]|uniref:Uncharacterized protein n=1 Tax=Cichlidogyrus casuarinus TaxID=1844966 RepID=A0ABD2Q9G3_9PLAT
MFRLFQDDFFSLTLFDPLIEISQLEENFKSFQTIKYAEKRANNCGESRTDHNCSDQEVKDIIELLSNIPAAEAKRRLKCPQRTGKMIPVYTKTAKKRTKSEPIADDHDTSLGVWPPVQILHVQLPKEDVLQ